VLDALAAKDADAAHAVWKRDEEIDDMNNSLFRELLTYMMEDPRTITVSTHILFIAKNLQARWRPLHQCGRNESVPVNRRSL